MPSEPQVKQLHEEFLVLLKRFHKMCLDNGIQYTLHGGTLLGAVREKGFIPWDDDTDVAMTRRDYEKLRAAVGEDGMGRDVFFSTYDHKPRLIMQREGRPFAWIDILIYDYISENTLAQKCKILGVCFLVGFVREKRESLQTARERGAGKLKYAGYQLAFLLGRPFPHRLKYRLFDSFCHRCFCGRRRLIHRSNDQYSGVIMIFPKQFMEGYMLVPFEDTELMVNRAYEELLKRAYGEDYMTPKKNLAELRIHAKLRDTLREQIENAGPGSRSGT